MNKKNFDCNKLINVLIRSETNKRIIEIYFKYICIFVKKK